MITIRDDRPPHSSMNRCRIAGSRTRSSAPPMGTMYPRVDPLSELSFAKPVLPVFECPENHGLVIDDEPSSSSHNICDPVQLVKDDEVCVEPDLEAALVG